MKRLPTKKVICFDFDGTLVDSMERLTRIAEEVMSTFFEISQQEARRLYTETSGLPFPQQLESLYPKESKKRGLAAALFEEKKRANYMEEPAYPDTHSTLDYLRNKKYRIVISSNSEQDLVTRLVEKLDLKPDLAFGFQPPMEKGRPHFQKMMQRFQVSESDLVFVGDSLKDGDRAQENGIDFIGKTGTFLREDFEKRFPGTQVIATLAELKKIL